MVPRGRLVRAAGPAAVAISMRRSDDLGQRVARLEAAALERARRILSDAEARARRTLERAELEADSVRLRAEEVGRANGAARIASWAAKLAHSEAFADRRNLERSIEMARILAHRLLGRALELDPGVVTDLAKRVLDETRGARRIVFATHPEDVPLLETTLADLGVEGDAVVVAPDSSLERGDFRLNTDVGVIDARLEPQLRRLTERLKDMMQA